MMKKLVKILIIILIAITTTISIFSSTAVAAQVNSTRSVRTDYFIKGNGSRKRFYKIVSANTEYTNFCAKGGAHLSNWVIYPSTDFYSLKDSDVNSFFRETDGLSKQESYHALQWLVDNLYTPTSNKDTKKAIKENLKQILAGNNAAIDAVDSISDDMYQVLEACAVWRFTNNSEALKNNAVTENAKANILLEALVSIAKTKKDYIHTSSKVEISTNEDFRIAEYTNSQHKAGPFIANTELDTSKIKVFVNEVETEATIEYEAGNKYYAIIPDASLELEAGKSDSVRLAYSKINTEALFLRANKKDYQNVISIRKTIPQIDAAGTQTTKEKKLDVALVKTIVSYQNPETINGSIISYGGEEVKVDRFNPNEDISTNSLDDGSSTDAVYTVKKNPVMVKKGAKVKYNIYVFNEGEVDADVSVVDYLPNGLVLADNQDEFWIQEGNKITYNKRPQTINAYKKDGNLSYAVFEVECKLTTDDTIATPGRIFTNYAEVVVENPPSAYSTLEDIDSTEDNMDVNPYGEPEPSNDYDELYKTGKRENKTPEDAENTMYSQEDDDDFERIIIADKSPDLALRKFISKINDTETEGREPLPYASVKVAEDGEEYGVAYEDVRTIQKFLKDSTSGGAPILSGIFVQNEEMGGATTYKYEHSKEPLQVYNGDYITYTIRVYNEALLGNYDGYAYKIIDKLPQYLVFDADKTAQANTGIDWLRNIEVSSSDPTGKTLNINAKQDKSYVLDNMLQCYVSNHLAGKDIPEYQEVHIVCQVVVPENAENAYSTDTNFNYMINTAQIAEYVILKDDEYGTDGELGKIEIINPSTETARLQNKGLLDRDSTVSKSNIADDSNKVYEHAEDIVETYDQSQASYIPGIQDDDDFDTVYIKRLEGNYNFNIKKVNDTNAGISDIKFQYSYNNGTESISNTITTDGNGNANIISNQTIPASWVLNNKILSVELSENPESTNNKYIPLQDKIYAYFNFKQQGENAVLDNVKISTIKYENITQAQFNSLGTSVNAKLANNDTVAVSISKSTTGNNISVKIPNKQMQGKFDINILKRDKKTNEAIGGVIYKIEAAERDESQKDTTTVVNGQIINVSYEDKSDSTGKVNALFNLVNLGWNKITISEIDATHATNNKKYVKIKDPIDIYYYTEVVNYQYKVTRVGFSQTDYLELNTIGTKRKNVKLVNDEEVAVSLTKVTGELNVIIENKEITGNYGLKIKKVNKNNPSEVIQGAKFEVKDTTYSETTASNGVATLINNYPISGEAENSFIISEVYTKAGYKALKYHDIEVKITTGLSSDKTKYIVTNVSVSPVLNVTLDTQEKKNESSEEEQMLNKNGLEVNFTDKLITVTVPNEPTTEYSLEVQKLIAKENETDEQQFLSTAKFTIKGPDGAYIVNNKGLVNGKKLIEAKDVSIGKSYKYTIKEDSAPEEFKDIFKGAWIELTVVIDENGAIDQQNTSYSIEFPNGVLDEEKIARRTEIGKYIQGLVFEENNKITLAIENPRYEGDYKLQIVKVGELETDKLSNVSFKINGTKYTTNSNGLVKFKKNNSEDIIISANTVKQKDVYTISEINLGNNNYIKLANSFKVYVSKGVVDEEYKATGVSFTQDGEPQLQATTTAELENGENVTVKAKLENNIVTVTIPNNSIEGVYSLKIKKVSEGDPDEVIGGAKFLVDSDQTEKVTNQNTGIADILSDNKITVKDQTFTHIIKETEVPEGYTKLNYYDIKVDIQTELKNENGNKKYAPSKVTLTPIAKQGTNVNNPKAKEEENMLLQKLSYEINDDLITITVPNNNITDYSLKIIKQDADGNNIEGAVFKVTKPDNTSETSTLPVSGKLIEANSVDAGKTYTYSIEEETAPEGYKNILSGAKLELKIVIDEQGNIDTTNTTKTIKITETGLTNAQRTAKLAGIQAYINDLRFDTTANRVILEIKDPSIKGDYALKIVKVGENNNERLSGVSFKVQEKVADTANSYNEKEIPSVATNNGEATIDSGVQITYTGKADIFTIEEIGVGTNQYTPLADSLTLYVSKEVQNEVYKLKGVSFEENGEAEEEVTTIARLNNGKTVQVKARIDDNLVTITIENKKLTGKYKLQLAKIDSITKEKLQGVSFTVTDANNNTYNVADTDSNGIAKVKDGDNEELTIKNENPDVYTIKETRTANGYSLIKYHNIVVTVTKELSSDNSSYVIKNATYAIVRNDVAGPTNEIKNEYNLLYEGVKKSTNNELITITIPNQKTTSYSLELIKQDADDDSVCLSTAKFTLTDPTGVKLLDNEPFANGTYLGTFNNVVVNKTYTYTLTEDEVPAGYKEVFKDIKLQIKLKINKQGKLVSSGSSVTPVVTNDSLNSVEKLELMNKAKQYIGSLSVDSINNKASVTLTNPKIKGKYGIKITKTGETDSQKVSGVNFTVVENKANEAGDVETSTKENLTTGTNGEVIVEDNSVNITYENKDIKDKYTIREVNVGTNNYSLLASPISIFVEKEEVDDEYVVKGISFDENGTASTEATKVATLQNGKTVVVNAKVEDNMINVTIPNKSSVSYKLQLEKLKMNGSPLSGATFNVTGAQNFENITLGTSTITNNNVNVNTEYVYTITENTAPAGYKNVLNGANLKLTIKVNANGVVDQTETKYEINITDTGLTDEQINEKKAYISQYINELTFNGNTVILGIKNPTIEGAYGLKIVKVGEDDSVKLNGVNFRVIENKTVNSTKTTTVEKENQITNSNGEVVIEENDAIKITKDNVNLKDSFTIIETSVGTGNDYVPLKENLTVFATKEQVGETYRLKGISFTENGEPLSTVTTQVLLKNNARVSVTATVENNNLIVVKISNKKVEGSYSLKLRKVNSVNNAKRVQGVQFSVVDNTGKVYNVDSTNASGETTIKDGTNANLAITEAGTDVYTISETSAPNGYKQILYHDIELRVTKVLSEDGTIFIVSNYEVEIKEKSNLEGIDASLIQKERQMLNSVQFNEQALTLIVPNEPITSYSLRLIKQDAEDNTVILSDAKFTLKGPDGNLLVDNAGFTNAEYSKTFNNVDVNKTYKFELTENQVQDSSYEEVFKDIKLEIVLKIKSDGKIDTNAKNTKINYVVTNNSLTTKQKNAAVAKAKSYVEGITIDSATNTAQVILKNPKIKTDYKLSLYKHLINTDDVISGAEFVLYKVIPGSPMDTYEELGRYTTPIDVPLLTQENILGGQTFTYRLYEETIPQGYSARFRGVEFNVNVSQSGEVSIELERVAVAAGNWANAIAFNDLDNYIKVISKPGNEFLFDFTNQKTFDFKLVKEYHKEGQEVQPEHGNAEFIVEKVGLNTNTVLFNNSLSDNKYEYTEENAAKNGVYKYRITETNTSSEFTNALVNVPMQVTVVLDENADIKQDETKVEVLSTDPKDITAFNQLVKGVTFENNKVVLTIDNDYSDYYTVQILKVDEDGNPLDDATFRVALPNGNFYDTDPDTAGNQHPVTQNGIICLPKQDIGSGASQHVYDFIENTPPVGYTKLPGSIQLTVDLTNVHTLADIQNNVLTLKYFDDANNEYNVNNLPSYIDGLSVNVTSDRNTPLITVTIPNKGVEHKFKLRKVDTEGNLINATQQENAITEGAKFSVVRKLISSDNAPAELIGTQKPIRNKQIIDGTFEDETGSYPDSLYGYTIIENSAKSGFTNVLDGYEVRIYAKTDSNARIIHPNANNTGDTHFEIIKTATGEDCTQAMSGNVILNVTEENGKDVINVAITNPVEYNMNLQKVNTADNGITVAKLRAVEVNSDNTDGTTYTMQNASQYTTPYKTLGMNEVQTWKIYEDEVAAPYVNVLDGKYIEVKVKGTSEGPTILSYVVKNNDGTEVEANDKAYEFIKEPKVVKTNDRYTVQVIVENPTTYRVKLVKCDTAGNEINYAWMVISGPNGFVSSNLGNGDFSSSITASKEISKAGEQSEFTIRELRAYEPYQNMLGNKQIKVIVESDENGNIRVADHYVLATTEDSEPYKTNEVDEYYKVYHPTIGEDGIPEVKVELTNPLQYKFKVTKTKADAQGTPLNGPELIIETDEDGQISNNRLAEYEKLEDKVGVGDVKVYRIFEEETTNPHDNILFLKMLKVTVTMGADGNVSCDYKICRHNGVELDDDDEAYNYVSVFVDNQNIDVVNVKIENPVDFHLNVYKQDEKGQPYRGANFELAINGEEPHGNNGWDYIFTTIRKLRIGDELTYKITESSTTLPHVNILENKYILAKVRLNEDEEFEVTEFNVYDNENNLIQRPNDVYSFISYKLYQENSSPYMEVYITNPIKYNVKVVKYDTLGNEITAADLVLSAGGSTYTNDENGQKTSSILYTADKATVRELRMFQIRENSVDSPYENVFDGKYIWLDTKVNRETGKVYVNTLKIYREGTFEEVPSTDRANDNLSYEIVEDEDGVETIVIKLKNPAKYEFRLTKTDNNDPANNLSGANITVERDGEEPIPNNGIPYINFTETITKPEEAHHTYIVREKATVAPHTNVLGDRYVQIDTELKADGTFDFNWDVKESDGTIVNRNDKIYEYVYCTFDTATHVLNVNLKNPVKYAFTMKKTTTAGSSINIAKLRAIKLNADGTDGEEFTMDETYSLTTAPKEIKIGESQEWKIYEDSAQLPYENILGNNYIYVKVHATENTFELEEPYVIKTQAGVTIERNDQANGYLYGFVDVQITKRGETYYINAAIQDPTRFKVDFIKYDKNDNRINDADISITKYKKQSSDYEFVGTYSNNRQVIDGKTVYESSIGFDERIVRVGDMYKYTFKENATNAPYTNVLKDKAIDVYVTIRPNGKPQITSYNLVDDTDEERKVISRDDVAYRCIKSVRVVEENGIPVVRVELENPYGYIFDLEKIDTNGIGLYGASLTVENMKTDEVVSNSGNPSTRFTEENIMPGESITYKIKEISTRAPRVNVLDGYYVLLTVTMKNDGNIEKEMKIYNEESEVAMEDTNKLYSYVICEVEDGDMDTVKLTIKNPIEYSVNIHKLDTQENFLPGAVIKIKNVTDDITYSNGGKSAYTLPHNRVASVGEEITYEIREESTTAPHVNVLEGKYIKLVVKISEGEGVSVQEFKVYEERTNRLVDDSDPVYRYISYEIIYRQVDRGIIVKIKNPIKYQFKVVKYDTDNNEITAAELEVKEEDIMGTDYTTYTNTNGTERTSSVLIKEDIADIGTQKIYKVKELSVSDPYVNILNDKEIYIVTRVLDSGEVKILAKYIIGSEGSLPETDEAFKYVTFDVVTEEDGTQTVLVKVENPFTYNFRITKVDTNNPPRQLDGPVLRIEKDGYGFTNQGNAVCETTETNVKIGTVSTYKITETASKKPHVNVLGKRYIKFNVEMLENGNVEIQDYKIYEPDGTPVLDSDKIYTYVTCNVIPGDIDTVNVQIKNPIEYLVTVKKVDTRGNPLSGADIDIVVNNNDGYNNGSVSNYTLPAKTVDVGETVTYKITENSTTAPHVNILEGKYILATVTVKPDETVSADYWVYNAETDERLGGADDAFRYISSEVVRNGDVQEVIFEIENPVEFNLEVIKKDTANNEISCAVLDVNDSGYHYSNNGTSRVTLNKKNMDIGQIKRFTIREISVQEPYENILNGKMVELKVKLNEDSKLEIVGLKLFNDHETYFTPVEFLEELKIKERLHVEIVQVNGIETVQLVIENPYKYNFKITKQDMEGNNLRNALFNIEEGTKKYTNMYEAVRTIEEKGVNIGETKTYKITEADAPAPYVNILKGYYILLDVTMNEDGTLNVSEDNLKIFNEETNAEVLREDTTNTIYQYVSLVHGSEDGIDFVNVIVKDPIEFRLNVIKENTDKQELEGANIKIEVADKEFNTEGNSNYTILTRGLRFGQEVVYKITETETVIPHVNILDGKYILLTARIEEGWDVSVASLVVYDAKTNTPVSEDDEAYKFIKKSTVEDAIIPTIVVRIENPLKYNINVNKSLYGTNGRIAMNNVGINISSEFSGEHELTTNEVGNVHIEENAVEHGNYAYTITETRTSGERFINILEGHYIKVFTNIDENGVLSILDKDGNISEEAYYIYNSETNELVDFDDTEIDKYVKVGVENNNGVYSLEIYIENPQEFAIELVKTDRTSGKEMNNVEFSVVVKDDAGKDVTLTSSKELGEELDLSSLTTETVGIQDGVININNILIERAGTFVISLEEKLTDEQALLYHDVGRLSVVYDIVETDEEYEIANVRVVSGDKYISAESIVHALKLHVENEQLKGSYKFNIVKIDDYSNKLENIGFKVNNKQYVTDVNGAIPFDLSLEGKGWHIMTVEETDSRNATNGKDYAKADKFEIYRYTDIVNNKYVVTKIGFSDKQGDYIEIPETGSAVLSKPIKTENPNRFAVVVLTANAADENGVVSVELVIPNPEVIGKYRLDILKVDQNDKPIEDVTFKVNGEVTEKTDGQGKVKVIEKDIKEAGTDEYLVSEIKAASDLLVLADPVTVKVNTVRKDGKYVASKAYFDNDIKSTTKTVLLNDGTTKVTLEVTLENDVVTLKIPNQLKDFDLALRKFITAVNGAKLEGKDSREPVVDLKTLINGDPKKNGEKTATYTHTKEPLLVNPTDIVEYTLRIYNECEVDGYANRIIDDVPEGVTMVKPEYDSNGKAKNLNAEYGWEMYKEMTDKDSGSKAVITYNNKKYVQTEIPEEAVIISTRYLSKENGEDNLLKAFDGKTLSYKDIKIEFKVNPTKDVDKIITNYAQISEHVYKDGTPIDDRDSTPNVWKENEDDQDVEHIKVTWFDLALYKWVSTTIVTEDGKTKEYASGHTQNDKDKLVNVTVAKDKLDKTVVKFKWIIKVENQGVIAGYAKELKDHIPAGLKFVPSDNTKYGWKLQEDGTITTDYLKDTLLQPKETAEVEVVLTWINGENNLGRKVNSAEISKDYNKYGAPDIDSTPNNFTGTPKEDDEDNDEVRLNIQTGSGIQPTYFLIGTAFIAIIAGGIVVIKKYVLKTK